MGVPFYFPWIYRNMTDVIKPTIQRQIDYLIFDLNAIVHPQTRSILLEGDHITIPRVVERMLLYIDDIIDETKPQKVVLAADGTAPVAKQIQQRHRRHMSRLETHSRQQIYIKNGREPPMVEKWDSTVITAGTQWFIELTNALSGVLKSREDGIEYIVSDSNEPGEGEHKAFDLIRRTDPKYSFVIVGMDADLIMLSLTSHRDNVWLYREATFIKTKQVNARGFVYLDVWNLRKHIIRSMTSGSNTALDENRIIEDFLAITFLLGCDFLPHNPCIIFKRMESRF